MRFIHQNLIRIRGTSATFTNETNFTFIQRTLLQNSKARQRKLTLTDISLVKNVDGTAI